MATLFGRQWTRQELLTYVGDISQLGGIRLSTLADGPERGVRAADVRTGGGLNFTVLLDRGMDIGQAEYRGVPLAWVSATGPVAPAFYEPHGTGWLRTFHTLAPTDYSSENTLHDKIHVLADAGQNNGAL